MAVPAVLTTAAVVLPAPSATSPALAAAAAPLPLYMSTSYVDQVRALIKSEYQMFNESPRVGGNYGNEKIFKNHLEWLQTFFTNTRVVDEGMLQYVKRDIESMRKLCRISYLPGLQQFSSLPTTAIPDNINDCTGSQYPFYPSFDYTTYERLFPIPEYTDMISSTYQSIFTSGARPFNTATEQGPLPLNPYVDLMHAFIKDEYQFYSYLMGYHSKGKIYSTHFELMQTCFARMSTIDETTFITLTGSVRTMRALCFYPFLAEPLQRSSLSTSAMFSPGLIDFLSCREKNISSGVSSPVKAPVLVETPPLPLSSESSIEGSVNLSPSYVDQLNAMIS